MITKVKFKSQKQIIPKFTVTTEVPKVIGGYECIISVLSGAVWIDSLTTATVATGFKLLAGDNLTLTANTISFISDATGSDVQIIIFNE